MTFKEYYGEPFRSDLGAIVASCPSLHSDWQDVVVQPRTLSIENPAINGLTLERRNLFATALFFTVLVDQVCYTHFRAYYPQFRDLTRYPKFRGDCPGGCHSHLHPKSIFNAIGSPHGPAYNWSGRARFVDDAIEIMRAEVLDFFNTHLNAVDGEDFWRRCVEEMPQRTRVR
ncbi:hypothetical protein FCG40_02965 [Fimbriimonadia bacterium ATM]|nr:hypothetical protein [Fimbriimonadia bacterium ATM]